MYKVVIRQRTDDLSSVLIINDVCMSECGGFWVHNCEHSFYINEGSFECFRYKLEGNQLWVDMHKDYSNRWRH